MKKLEKIAIAAAVVLIPLSIFATEKKSFQHNLLDNKKEMSSFDTFDHDDAMDNRYFQSKGINYTFEGKIEKRPLKQINGEWIISGIKVIVNDTTLVSHGDKNLKIGEEVEILAIRKEGIITAVEMEED